MNAILNGIRIKHNGVCCDMDCPYFQLVTTEDEENPFQPSCSLFKQTLPENLERTDACLAADKAYLRKLEIHRLRGRFFDRPFMLQILKRINYAFDPSESNSIQEFCDKLVGTGKVTMEEIQKATELSDENFANLFSAHPYPYVLSAFKKVFSFPVDGDITLKDRLNMAARRIRLDD